LINRRNQVFTGYIKTAYEKSSHRGVPIHLFLPPVDALIAETLWHFWNGVTFGLTYALIVGKGKWWCGMIWGFIVGIGMMLAPWLVMMMGPFGINFAAGYNIFLMTLA